MSYLLIAYAVIGYWYFRKTLQHIESYDTWDTVLLNAALALTIGPILLIPAFIFGKLDKHLHISDTWH